jgi:hypothetical protein
MVEKKRPKFCRTIYLVCGGNLGYFILHITMRCMVETQYAAAGCLSTASLLYTSDFILHTSYFKRKPLQVVAVWLGGVRGG